ncbi:hypothetical protein MNV49_007517 [Pseudohyphozyma bogoriensis]|nr:hypothetical protein MNV49_007517 [Pseudohyphozyma bogoriensis]
MSQPAPAPAPAPSTPARPATEQLAVLPESNPRGIPKAVDSVADCLGEPDEDAEPALKSLWDVLAYVRQVQVYGVEAARWAGLDEKVPALQRTLATVETLQREKDDAGEFETTFEFSDTLCARGAVNEVDEANTMLSYPLPNAHALLPTKLSTDGTSLRNAIEGLAFLRDQITVIEVNVAIQTNLPFSNLIR